MPWEEIRSRLLFLAIAWCGVTAHLEVMPSASIGRKGYWIWKDRILGIGHEAAGLEEETVDEIGRVSVARHQGGFSVSRPALEFRSILEYHI